MLRQKSPDPHQEISQNSARGRGVDKQISHTNNAIPRYDDFKLDQGFDKAPLQQHDGDKASSGLRLHAFQLKTAEPDQSWPDQPTKDETNMTESNLYAMFHEVQHALMGLCHSVDGLGDDVHSLQDEVGEVHDALDYVSNRFSEVTEVEHDAAGAEDLALAQTEVFVERPDGYASISPLQHDLAAPRLSHPVNRADEHEDVFYTPNRGSCPLNAIRLDTRSLANTCQLCPFGYTPASYSPMGFQVQPAFNCGYSPNHSSGDSPTFWNDTQSQAWTATQLACHQSTNPMPTFESQVAATAVPTWLAPVNIPNRGSIPMTAGSFARAHSRRPSRRGSQCTTADVQLQTVKRMKTLPFAHSMVPPPHPQPRAVSPERWHKTRCM